MGLFPSLASERLRNASLYLLLTAISALLTGTGLAWWFTLLSSRERQFLRLPALSTKTRRLRSLAIILASTTLFILFQWASLELGCLDTPEVQPSGAGRTWRLVYQLTLLALLVVATAIDFDCYMIPDSITLPGTLIGLLGATIIGEVQICHLWVDWSVAIPQLRGP